MRIPCVRPIHRRPSACSRARCSTTLLAIAALGGLAPAADTLHWDITAGTSGAQGGNGTWNTTNTNWWNPLTSANTAWVNGAHASFGGPAGNVTLGAGRSCTDLRFTVANYRITTGNNLLSIAGATPHVFEFQDSNTRYNASGSPNHGLRLTSATTLLAKVRGSAQSTITADAAQATFGGTWWKQNCAGTERGYWRIQNGATLIVGAAAEVNTNMADLVNSRFITAIGEGTGTNTLDLNAGFIADRMGYPSAWTNNGMSWLGISGSLTMISRHTQNLPTVSKLVPVRDAMGNVSNVYDHHGLLIIAPASGNCDIQPASHTLRWIVDTNAQSYDGGLNWSTAWTLETRQDLTFNGIYGKAGYGTYVDGGGNLVRWAEPKTAFGPRGSITGTVLTKTGSAKLIIAGNQGWTSGSVLRVTQGEVRFDTDPALDYFTQFGTPFPSSGTGNHLRLLLEAGRARFAPVSTNLHGIYRVEATGGTFAVADGTLSVAQDVVLGSSAATELRVGSADASRTKVPVAGSMTLAGSLTVIASGTLPAGDVVLMQCSGTRTGTFGSVSVPAGRAISYTANAVKLVPTGGMMAMPVANG